MHRPPPMQMPDGIPCRNYTAASVEEFLEILTVLSDCERIQEKERRERAGKRGGGQIPRLWYRGQQQTRPLLPSLFRKREESPEYGYSRNHAREDYRYQHFRSKCNQLVTSYPDSKIEWMELMQHHGLATRLMDWSESAMTALMFAVEPFLNPDRRNHDLLHRRSTINPVVWVLNPLHLNRNIYQSILDHPGLYANRVFQDVYPVGISHTDLSRFRRKLACRLAKKRDTYFMDETDCGIVSLSVLENERQADAGRLYQLLRGDEFNPYFYLLLRYYNDGILVDVDLLPPLAMVHPYHSQRIQTQHGVFTVSPHYRQDLKGEDRRPMDCHPLAEDCVYQIRIVRPAQIAEELLEMGERLSALYPELERYTSDIESEADYML